MNWLPLLLLSAFLSIAPCQGGVDRLRCPARLLKGGRVRIRSKGRVIKYVCLRGYQVLGEKYSTCIRGKWDTPVPICISGGCQSVDVLHGQVLETYRGAFVTVHCDPGYSLTGPQSLYCNGAVWNDTLPVCREIAVTAQKWCDFESEDLCGWTHDLSHDFDWKRHNFATPSGHVGTGPSFDHTLGPGLNGHYMYLETSSPRLQNDTARLFSPVFPAQSNSSSCFIFWYHMFGVTTGSLNVYLHNQETVQLFSNSGDQGDQWKKVMLPLPSLKSSFQIVIEGVRGTGYEGDIAIDDVKLTEGEECLTDSTIGVNDNYRTLDVNSCEERCFTATANPAHCECTPDCLSNNTCCPDYLLQCSTPSTVSLLSTSKSGIEVLTSKEPMLPLNTIKLHTITVPEPTTSRHSASLKSVVTAATVQLSEAITTRTTPTTRPQAVEETPVPTQTQPTTSPRMTITYSTKAPKLTFTTAFAEIQKAKTQMLFTTKNKQFPFHTQLPTKLPTQHNIKPKSNIVPSYSTTSFLLNKTTPKTAVSSTTLKPKSIMTSKASPVIRNTISNTVSWFTNKTTIKSFTNEAKTPIFIYPTKNPSTSKVIISKPKQKIVFVTLPPPVVFRTPSKTNPPKTTLYRQFTKHSQRGSINVLFPTSTLTPKIFRNSSKSFPRSKNDVLHPVWTKETLPPPPPPTLGPRPRFTIHHITQKTSSVSSLLNNHTKKYSGLDTASTASQNKWKSKYQSMDDPPVHAPFALSSPSNKVVHLVILASGVLLILSVALATVCAVRRRKINRRSSEEDELDIRFLPSDEILDFTLARPSPDTICETMR